MSDQKKRIAYVIALNKDSNCVAIRHFENTDRGELDYEEELDAVCEEVGWNCVWVTNNGELTADKLFNLVCSLKAYATGGDEGWAEFVSSIPPAGGHAPCEDD